MIGISAQAEQQQIEWERKDKAAWMAEADKLKAMGWKLRAGNTRRPYFTKAGQVDLVLTRKLGTLDWTARPK